MLKRIEEMRREQALIAEQVKELAGKEEKGEKLSADDVEKFNELNVEFKSLGDQITRAQTAESMAITAAKPVDNISTGTPAVHVKKAPVDYPGAKVARFAMAIAAGDNNMESAAHFAEAEIGDKEVAMAISTASNSGGALVPENLAADIIELLRPKTVVRALGATVVPLANGNLTMPRLTGGASSGYKGENASHNAENATLDEVKLSAKTQMAIVPMSNELIGTAGQRVESIFLNDMISAVANRQDKAFLRDDGTNNTPTGFKKTATDAGKTVAWSGTADLATIDAYLDSLILGLMESDSNMFVAGWAMSPRSFMKLQGLKDGNGNKAYPEMAQGMLKGWPIKHTTNIPVNLGAGTDETEIYFADWSDVIIGETDQFTIDFSRDATYNNSSGTLVSAFSSNQSVLRVVTGNDIGFRHLEGLQMGTGITW